MSLAPENSQIKTLMGLLEVSRGRSAEAIAHLRKAIELDAQNFKAVYSLAQEIERLGGDKSEAEAQSLLEKILEAQPDNLAVLLEVTRLAAKRGDSATLQKTVARIAANAAPGPPRPGNSSTLCRRQQPDLTRALRERVLPSCATCSCALPSTETVLPP